MSPAQISTLAASLAESELPAGSRCVLLSIAAATDKDCITHLSAGRLGDRCGLSRGHVMRVLRQLEQAEFIHVETVPGRASKIHVSVSVRCNMGATGVSHGRDRGVTWARHISSHTSGQLPTRAAAAGPKGPPPPAWDSAYVPDDGADLPSPEQRAELLAQVRQAMRERASA